MVASAASAAAGSAGPQGRGGHDERCGLSEFIGVRSLLPWVVRVDGSGRRQLRVFISACA